MNFSIIQGESDKPFLIHTQECVDWNIIQTWRSHMFLSQSKTICKCECHQITIKPDKPKGKGS